MTFIETLEITLGRPAQKEFLPMQPDDVMSTYADVQALNLDIGFEPSTPLPASITQFVAWFKEQNR